MQSYQQFYECQIIEQKKAFKTLCDSQN